MNEQIVYEWLKGLPCGCFIYTHLNGEKVASGEDENGPWEDPLPPLDMNTAFSEGIPKLTKEGCDVKFTHGAWDLQPMRKPWHGPYYARSDFWLAVDEYLEAK